jgi:hypothetical protein
MCAGYLERMEKYDKPSFYWPFLTFFWIVMFLFYIWSKDNIWIFYYAIVGFVAYLMGVYTRNYYRKKKK